MPTYKHLIIAWLFVPLHRLLFRLSRGRIWGRLEGVGVLILVTKGRRTGKRCSSLLMYFQFEQGGDLVAAASNYCQGRHPRWHLDITANPNVSVEVDGKSFAAQARITQDHERTELFDKVVERNARFANYRASRNSTINLRDLK